MIQCGCDSVRGQSLNDANLVVTFPVHQELELLLCVLYIPATMPKVTTKNGMLTARKDTTNPDDDNNAPANIHLCSPNLDTKYPEKIPKVKITHRNQ